MATAKAAKKESKKGKRGLNSGIKRVAKSKANIARRSAVKSVENSIVMGEENSQEKCDEKAFRNFMGKHWQGALGFIVFCIIVAVVGILTFLQIVADAQATSLVPAMLGEWTVGYFITFILTVILWELVYVGIWAIPITIVIYYGWYDRLPARDRLPSGKKSTGKDTGDAFGFFVFLAWLVIVWLEGRWNLAFQSWTLDNWIFSWLAAIIWIAIIIGIPAAIVGTGWLCYTKSKKKA